MILAPNVTEDVMGFKLFLEAGDARNDSIRASVESNLGKEFEAVICPPGTSDWYRTPFVRDADGTAYFGVDAIRAFVNRKKAEWGSADN